MPTNTTRGNVATTTVNKINQASDVKIDKVEMLSSTVRKNPIYSNLTLTQPPENSANIIRIIPIEDELSKHFNVDGIPFIDD